MRVLFDSSALYKRYHVEPGADRIASIGEDATVVVASCHCKTEIASALNRQRHDGFLDGEAYARIMAAVQRDFADMQIVPVDEMVETFAIAAMERTRLRAMDALHIGTAQAQRVGLFVTADRKQALAAQAVGLKTEFVGV